MSHGPTIPFDPNLVDEDRSSGLFITLTVMTIAITLSTGSRLIGDVWQRTRNGPAEYFIFIAYVFNLTSNILEYQSINEGFGRHLQFLTHEQEATLRRLNAYTLLFINIALWATKMSIAFFILGLLRNVHKRTKWVCYGLMILTTVSAICHGVFWGIQARPIQKLWMPEIPGTVASRDTIIISIITFTCIHSVTDLFFALSPIYFFGRLQMDLRKKMIILSLTGSGLLVVATAFIRTAFVQDFYSPDFSWALSRIYLCAILERNFAEFIADLPATYYLVKIMRERAGSVLSSVGVGTWTGGSRRSQGGRYASNSNKNNNTGSGPGVLTIGSMGKRNARAAQSVDMEDAISDDEVCLREVSPSSREERGDGFGSDYRVGNYRR